MKRTYTNGYWPKIQYWTSELAKAVVSNDLRDVDYAHGKLNYFIGKQAQLEGGNVIAGVDFSESLNILKNL